MNGYLRIKNTDLYERDGVTYWRNGGNIIGNVVKAVIEENDVVTSETYYIESLKTAKAIMLDPDVKIGGLTASESKNGNFIIVATEPADFTEYGGGAGLKITFIYGVNYYSIETVELNGDIKIYDPDGESGTITPDALPDTTDAAVGDTLVLDEDKKPVWGAIPTPEIPKKYVHNIELYNSSGPSYYYFSFINNVSTPYTSQATAIKALYDLIGENEYMASGFQTRTVLYSIAPKSIGTFTAYGTSFEISNGALSFTKHDDWGVSVTTLTCNDRVYEI